MTVNTIHTCATMVQIGSAFKTMAEAREAITRFLLDAGQSYKVYKGDSNRYILICKKVSPSAVEYLSSL